MYGVKTPSKKRGQSAMEYLTTYGWAILIIAIVLAALFALGIFNLNSYSSRARPGGCQVQRPYGIATTSYIGLAGLCISLEPQSTANFNGRNANIVIPKSNIVLPSNQLTVVAWVYANGSGTSTQDVLTTSTASSNSGYTLGTQDKWAHAQFSVYAGAWDTVTAPYSSDLGQWTCLVGTYNGGALDIYINGVLAGTAAQTGNLNPNTNNLTIGNQPGSSQYFSGELSNIQIYNTSFNANQVKSLCIDGIGGVPENLLGLIGWWPLNGNFNDYSGNANGGSGGSEVIYSSSWSNGYIAPTLGQQSSVTSFTTSSSSTSTSSTSTTSTVMYTYGAGNTVATSASNTLPSGYSFYLCAGSAYDNYPVTSYTQDASSSSVDQGYDQQSIGHQSSNVCSISLNPGGSQTATPLTVGGIGFDAPSYTILTSGVPSGSFYSQWQPYSFSYTVSSTTQLSVIMISELEPTTGPMTVTVPSGCTVVENINGFYPSDLAGPIDGVYIATCTGQSVGTQTVYGYGWTQGDPYVVYQIN